MTDRKWIPMLAAVALLGASSCGLFGDGPQTDGQVCSVDDDCSTGVCTSADLCSHSHCECPSGNCMIGGEQTSDCLDGWVCVGYDSVFDPIKEFFGGTPNPSDGYCQPSCEAGCPEHYFCGSDGELCQPDTEWVRPVPTIAWSGPVSGELSGHEQMTTVTVEEGSTITLTGSAMSPTGVAITSLEWTVDGEPVETESPTIEATVDDYFTNVELTVIDERSRIAILWVTFEACVGAGGTCGYQGSGCCNGCDDATNTCM